MRDFDKMLQEFLANGGKIQQIPAQEIPETLMTVHSSIPAQIHELGQGELLFSEFKPKKIKKKPEGPVKVKNVNMENLPPELVAKLQGRVKF
jgi:hypothetical protein